MRRISTLLLLAAASACERAPDPLAPGAEPSQPSFATSNTSVSQDPTPSQAAVAEAVPGFGGYFLDLATGAPTVYLTDPAQRPLAEQALAAFLADRGFTASDLQVRRAEYTYNQLESWYHQSRRDAFAVDGIVLGDVDEANNRIRFGVVDAAAVAGVQSVIARMGIPSGAVVVQQRAPIRTVATLRDNLDPLRGGLQINFLNAAGVRAVSFLCTLGFNANFTNEDNKVERSFITNSHCSTVEGGSETGTDYYQPLMDPDGDRLVNPENLIATEAHDPHWFSSLDCFASPVLQCRYSDAARARYNDNVTRSLGQIARTTRPSTSLTDVVLDIAGSFTIQREQTRGVVGETAHKVGRTTGWTSGRTTETCVDVLALGTTHIRLCQEIVAAVVDSGDSGSPAFRRTGVGSNVALLGILWGGSVDDTNPEFVYSPMFGIERELGKLRTH